MFRSIVGSSPRRRGKPSTRRRRESQSRLIPAHAGKTRHRRGSQVLAPAHPRSRGENNRATPGGEAIAGSSPLTRGKRQSDDVRRARGRLIPAHAGKTGARSPATAAATAHPRSRGENGLGESLLNHLQGSSPLTRGKRASGANADARFGLIPAHAGKTAWRPARSSIDTAHPRSRGENLGRLEI